jgi:two-component system LytT family sensor kinase
MTSRSTSKKSCIRLNYIAIEQARFGDKLTVIYDIDEEVNCVIPSLLIQPLVENAIVHGIQPCKGKGVVTISVTESGNRVRCRARYRPRD